MSILFSALTAHFLAHTPLTNLVGTRVYPEKLPESSTEAPNQMPAVTYKLQDEPLVITHDNELLYHARVEVVAWGGSYKSAQAVADQVAALLIGFAGVMGGELTVGGVFRKLKRDNGAENVGLFRVEQVFVMNYK